MPTRNRIRELRTVRAGELIADPRNWRQHPTEQRQALQAMLDRVGYVDAVVARETDDGLMLVDGHLRADLDADDEIPVLIVDLDDAEAGEVLASIDPLSAMATTDPEALQSLLDDLPPLPSALELPPLPLPPSTPASNEPVEPAPEPESNRGEIYRLGRHRIMCGDSTSRTDVALLLAGEHADAILTDPPYSSGSFQDAGKGVGSKGTGAAYKPIVGDNRSSRGYAALMRSVLDATTVNVIYVFTDWKMWVYLFDLAEAAGYLVRSMIVWNKMTPGMGMGWRSQHELVLLGTTTAGVWKGHQKLSVGNVIDCARQPNELHATQKPVELLETILNATPFAKSIYDPFLGSGSTLIAAENQGRTCYGMEIDPGYVDATIARWEAHTGNKAARVTENA